jgi:tetratricopeptide (TPR) repeat protein
MKHNRPHMIPLSLLVMFWLGQAIIPYTHGAESIGCNLNLSNHYGPFDYYDPANHQGETIEQVERRHLTPDMLMLRKGSTGRINGDLAYTLNAVPNHPQALDLASRLQMAVNSGRKPANEKLLRNIDCYFMRAVTMNPRMGETYYIWGLHFQRNSDYVEAYEKYEQAEAMGMDSAEFYYNFGLLQYSLKNYDLAKERADQTYSLGFPLEGLRKKLKVKGYYQ